MKSAEFWLLFVHWALGTNTWSLNGRHHFVIDRNYRSKIVNVVYSEIRGGCYYFWILNYKCRHPLNTSIPGSIDSNWWAINSQVKIAWNFHVQGNNLWNIENSDIQHLCVLKVFTATLKDCWSFQDMYRKNKVISFSKASFHHCFTTFASS